MYMGSSTRPQTNLCNSYRGTLKHMVRSERISLQKAKLNDIVQSMTQHVSPVKLGSSPSPEDSINKFRTEDKASYDRYLDKSFKTITVSVSQ